MTAQSLAPRPDLDQLKRQAKELLRRDPSVGRLRDAQRAIAHQYGFASWDALRTHVDSTAGSIFTAVTPCSAKRRAESGARSCVIAMVPGSSSS